RWSEPCQGTTFPTETLTAPHREPDDELDPLDAQVLRHEAMLTHDVVVQGDVGKDSAVKRGRGIARRGGQPLPNMLGTMMKYFLGSSEGQTAISVSFSACCFS